MKAKGSTVVALSQFVTARFGDEGFEKWLSYLSEETQHSLRYPLATSWYSAQETIVRPTRCMCELFFSEDLVFGARQLGAFSAEHHLTRIYRILLKIGSPNIMISMAKKSWRMFFSEDRLDIIRNEKGHAVMQMHGIPITDILWGEGIAAWFEKALILAGAKEVSASVTQTSVLAGSRFEFQLKWR